MSIIQRDDDPTDSRKKPLRRGGIIVGRTTTSEAPQAPTTPSVSDEGMRLSDHLAVGGKSLLYAFFISIGLVLIPAIGYNAAHPDELAEKIELIQIIYGAIFLISWVICYVVAHYIHAGSTRCRSCGKPYAHENTHEEILSEERKYRVTTVNGERTQEAYDLITFWQYVTCRFCGKADRKLDQKERPVSEYSIFRGNLE